MADLEAEKARAAAHAVSKIQDGMLVGLGTGSTAAHAVRGLAQRVADGLRITATATSQATETLAATLGIPLTAFDGVARVDLTIDGADEVDPRLRAIKGGGGALLREKVVATASDRMIIIVDSSKPVVKLGRFRLPVEVLPFAGAFAVKRLETLGAPVTQRMNGDAPFLTDQGAYIFDVAFGTIEDPTSVAQALEAIPGVIEHGLFLTEVDLVVIARGDEVEVLQRPAKFGA